VRASPAFGITLALFVFSGMTGLIDQLCFSKYLSYVVGSTAHAVSAVLAAFMTGLALGAHLGGKASLRIRRPLVAYGVLELVVALSVALSPLAFRALTPLYVALAGAAPGSLALVSGLRWVLAMLLVVLPTMAMGATLPLLSRMLGWSGGDSATKSLRERRLAALYAANTWGGALGAVAAAYWILPALGIAGTLLASATLSALIGALAIAFGRSQALDRDAAASESRALGGSDRPVPSLESHPLEAREIRLLTALAFASGALVFAAEVLFTHLLALIIGNSAYAFGIILAVFLLCLAFGASRTARVQKKLGDGALALGLSLTAFALALTIPLWERLPLLFTSTGQFFTTFAAREAVRAIAAFVMLALPTALMGLTFPLLLQRVARSPEVGAHVGRLTAVNTLGAVSGAMITGYAVLPLLGSQRALAALALAFAAAAVGAQWFGAGAPRKAVPALAAATALIALIMPRWDITRLTSGNNVYFDSTDPPDEVNFLREDAHGGVTTVVRRGSVHTLYTNGKFQGNDGWEMKAQRGFAHYPSLFVRNFDRTLVIGLGTGTTLGTIASYPWKHIDVVEISPAIIEAAGTFFSGPNRGALHDPRLTMHLADGRNHLLVHETRYDLISMELSSVWFAGAANLYSREFYVLARQHLAEGGVLQQWVQLHHIRVRDFATILNTLHREFAHVAMVYGGGQGVLIASEQPLRVSRARIDELGVRPAVLETLPDERPLEGLLDDTLVFGAGLDRFLDDVAREEGVPRAELISNDDNLYLEYATPRGNTLPWSAREALVDQLLRYRDAGAIAALVGP
jgi:spermidine synthase